MQFPFELKKEAEFDAIGFGTNAVDFLIQVPEYPAFDSKIELTNYVQAAGGEVATTMVGLQRLGMKTSYIGRFGKDSAGDFGIQSLKDEGVDVSHSEQIEDAKTQIAFIIIDERNGERTVIWKRDEKLHFECDEVDEKIVESTKLLHFTPHDTEACIKLAKAAQNSGAIVSIDIDNVFEGIEELLPLVDILISSAKFPGKLFGKQNNEDHLMQLHLKFGCGLVGMTLGEKGSLVLCKDEFVETQGYTVPGGCRDTTGAGDSFRAGFLYGLLNGDSIEDAAKSANAVAALKCRDVGARTALPTTEELVNLLGDKFR